MSSRVCTSHSGRVIVAEVDEGRHDIQLNFGHATVVGLRRILLVVADRADRLKQAFAALNEGDPSAFRELFAERAQWLGIPGTGFDGATPT